MSNRKKSSATATAGSGDDVEQLLQAAQDEVLLKLSVDAHMSRVAPDYLDPDLHRRFQALRSRPSTSQSNSKSRQPKQSPPPFKQQQVEERKEPKPKVVVDVDNVDEESRGLLGDDLSVRFAALKASLSSSNPTPAEDVRFRFEESNGDDEEDEVEKVVQWAMDAARLDPSPPSDDDDDYFDHITSDEDDTDDDDYLKNEKKESKSMY